MDEVKNEILKTCLKHFLKEGIRKMSNDKLVLILGISTKTLYKHFRDKEDLIAQALELFYSQQYRSYGEILYTESVPVIMFKAWQHGFEMELKVNKKFFQDLHHYYPDLEKRVEVRNVKIIWPEYTEIIERGKKDGVIREDLLPEAILESISVLYTSAVRKGNFKKQGLSSESLFVNTVATYLRGICTEKGVRILDAYIRDYMIQKEGGIKRLSKTNKEK